MIKTKKTLIAGMLIGKRVKVKNALNKSLIGISGTIVDETKNMLLLQTKKGKKKLIKKQVELEIK